MAAQHDTPAFQNKNHWRGTVLYAADVCCFFAGNRQGQHAHYLNLVPLKSILFLLQRIRDNGSWKYYNNMTGNVLLFMPLPFVLSLLKIRRFAIVVLAGFTLSFTIELLQYIFELGMADVDDLLLNTLGTVAGWACYRALNNQPGNKKRNP